MASKKKKQQTSADPLAANAIQQPSRIKNAVAGSSSSGIPRPYLHLLIMAVISILCWVFLRSCLSNQFTNWDDPGYIQDNVLVKSLDLENIKAIFSTPVMGNYHPLTILSYALEYNFAHLDPALYYFDNLILNVLDTLLVYWLVILLTKRPVAGIVTALLFGLHPMHVESVAWISERKDVLYVFFYLSACISYIYYLRTTGSNRRKWYVAVALLFVCALLSKPVAVTLPLTLLLIDYFERRQWQRSVLIEKIPHFLVALTFGIVALKVQQSAGAMDMQKIHYNFIERIALGGYAFVTYLYKAVLPVRLCNVYAYPLKVNGTIPLVYYLCPAAAIALVVLAWRYTRQNRILVFGFLLFLVNIALLLQFIQVGDAIIAERYSYLPYLGLFFIAGWYVSVLFEPDFKKSYGNILKAAAGVYMVTFFFISSARSEVWHDSVTLWLDAVKTDPVRNIGGYNNLGFIYYQRWLTNPDPYEKKKNYDSAYLFLNKAIELNPEYTSPYISLGEMVRGAGQFDEARNLYFKALKYSPKNPNMYLGLAILYYIKKDMDSAGMWFRNAIAADPSPQAYGNYANFLNFTGKTDSALVNYEIAIKRAPDQYSSYLNRSRVYRDNKRPDEAIKDLDMAIKLNPDLGDLYYERSMSYNIKGNRAQAIADVEKAISLGFNRVDNNYYQGLKQ
jgi:protein O-mannosyl-transferase